MGHLSDVSLQKSPLFRTSHMLHKSHVYISLLTRVEESLRRLRTLLDSRSPLQRSASDSRLSLLLCTLSALCWPVPAVQRYSGRLITQVPCMPCKLVRKFRATVDKLSVFITYHTQCKGLGATKTTGYCGKFGIESIVSESPIGQLLCKSTVKCFVD